MASNLSARVHRIELLIALLGEMRERLHYLQPTMNSLLRSLNAMPRYKPLGFLAACRQRMEWGEAFPVAWRGALDDDKSLGGEERTLLLGLTDVLGATDLDSQLSALDCTRDLMQVRLDSARAYSVQHGRLYRTMGVLCGVALVILLG